MHHWTFNQVMRWAGGSLLFLMTGLVVLSIPPRKDARLEALRQKGYPLTLEELHYYYPKITPESNSALVVYGLAFALPFFTQKLAVSERLVGGEKSVRAGKSHRRRTGS